jgi:hypothetical protein
MYYFVRFKVCAGLSPEASWARLEQTFATEFGARVVAARLGLSVNDIVCSEVWQDNSANGFPFNEKVVSYGSEMQKKLK